MPKSASINLTYNSHPADYNDHIYLNNFFCSINKYIEENKNTSYYDKAHDLSLGCEHFIWFADKIYSKRKGSLIENPTFKGSDKGFVLILGRLLILNLISSDPRCILKEDIVIEKLCAAYKHMGVNSTIFNDKVLCDEIDAALVCDVRM